MHTIVCFGDLWVNKASVNFLQQLDLKNKNKAEVQLYQFGINALNKERVRSDLKCLKNRLLDGGRAEWGCRWRKLILLALPGGINSKFGHSKLKTASRRVRRPKKALRQWAYGNVPKFWLKLRKFGKTKLIRGNWITVGNYIVSRANEFHL